MEMGVVVGLAYWAYHLGVSPVQRWTMAILVPTIVFGFWGAVDFRRCGKYAEWLRLAQELVISLLVAIALYRVGQRTLGWALAIVAVVHHAMVYSLGERLLKE